MLGAFCESNAGIDNQGLSGKTQLSFDPEMEVHSDWKWQESELRRRHWTAATWLIEERAERLATDDGGVQRLAVAGVEHAVARLEPERRQ